MSKRKGRTKACHQSEKTPRGRILFRLPLRMPVCLAVRYNSTRTTSRYKMLRRRGSKNSIPGDIIACWQHTYPANEFCNRLISSLTKQARCPMSKLSSNAL